MTNEDAIEILENIQEHMEETDFIDRCALDMAIEALKEQRPHGEWKRTDNRWGVGIWQCTNCERFYEIATKFCPNCGAKMERR